MKTQKTTPKTASSKQERYDLSIEGVQFSFTKNELLALQAKVNKLLKTAVEDVSEEKLIELMKFQGNNVMGFQHRRTAHFQPYKKAISSLLAQKRIALHFKDSTEVYYKYVGQ